MRTKKNSSFFILVLLVGMLVNARAADARSYASLDEPIGEGLAVAAAVVGNGGGAGLPLLWSNLTSRIGSGMYAAYCAAFCEEARDTNEPSAFSDQPSADEPQSTVNDQARTINDQSSTITQPSTINSQPRTTNPEPRTSASRPASSPTPAPASLTDSDITRILSRVLSFSTAGVSEARLLEAVGTLEQKIDAVDRSSVKDVTIVSDDEVGARRFIELLDAPSSRLANAIIHTNSGASALTQSSYFVYQGDKLGVASSTPTETLSVGGSAHLAGYLTLDQTSAPTITTDRLYNSAGDLYWAGNLIGGATTGNWTSDGTNVWRAGGKVGIGTTTPVHTLTVSTEVPLTDVDISALQGAGGKATIRAINNANQQTQITTFGYNATSTSLWSGVPSSGLSVWYANGVNAALVNHGAGDLYLINQYAAPRVTIASTTGYVGVATMNPKYRFDVSGAGRFTSFVDANYFVATGTQASSLPYASTTALTVSGTAFINALSSASALPLTSGFTLRGSSSNTAEATSSLFVASNGKVGIGTANPTARLHIETTSGGAPSSSESSLELVVGGYNVGAVGGNSTIGVFGQNRGGLLLGGKYTDGEMSNGFIKFLSGNRSLTSENTASVAVIEGIQTTGDAATGGRIRFSTRNPSVGLEYKMILNEYGNLGIGTTSPAFKLSVAGDVYASAFIDDGVTLAAPDYVFDDPDYLHLSLADIEAYTEAHKHLPWLTPRGSGAMSISARINEVLEALENLFLEVFELADWNRRQDEADAIRDQRIDALEAELRSFKAGSDSSQTNPGPAQQGGPGAEPASSSPSSSEGDDAESTEPEQTPTNPSEQAVDAADAPAPTATSEAPEFSEPATLDSGAVAVSASGTSF